MKRVVVISDLHCGHRVGLTPPNWQTRQTDADGYRKWGAQQAGIWNWYKNEIEALKPIHLLVVNGDLIDGQGKRSGGTELIAPDRVNQIKMAQECIDVAGATKIQVIRGTPYHSGEEEDWEDLLMRKNVKVGDFEQFTVNGLAFGCRHHIGNSSVPAGKHTALMNEALWDLIWAEANLRVKTDILIRSHRHAFAYCRGLVGSQLLMVTPGMQGFGSKFGSRKCSGLVDIGFVHFDVETKGEYTWKVHLLVAKFLVGSLTKY